MLNKSKDSIRSTTGDDYKYILPESCLLTFVKTYRIDKLKEKYVLLINPRPLIDGELLLF